MKEKIVSLFFAIVAIGIYFLFLVTFIFYFNFHNKENTKDYVSKNSKVKKENIITISLSKLPLLEKKKIVKKIFSKKKPLKKKIIKRVIKKRKIVTKKKKFIKKIVSKKIVIKKIIKKSKDKNIIKNKKVKSLFSNISYSKKVQKTKSSLFQNIKIKKRVEKERGIENIYLAKIKKILKGWPTQSEYAGEKAKVWLKIKGDGYFEFKVISASKIRAFNQGLKNYLKQLQQFGFGRHHFKRAYEINVEFIATQ